MVLKICRKDNNTKFLYHKYILNQMDHWAHNPMDGIQWIATCWNCFLELGRIWICSYNFLHSNNISTKIISFLINSTRNLSRNVMDVCTFTHRTSRFPGTILAFFFIQISCQALHGAVHDHARSKLCKTGITPWGNYIKRLYVFDATHCTNFFWP